MLKTNAGRRTLLLNSKPFRQTVLYLCSEDNSDERQKLLVYLVNVKIDKCLRKVENPHRDQTEKFRCSCNVSTNTLGYSSGNEQQVNATLFLRKT